MNGPIGVDEAGWFLVWVSAVGELLVVSGLWKVERERGV